MAATPIDRDTALLYIEEELSQHGEWLCDALTEAIEERGLVQSGALEQSVNYETYRRGENRGVRVKFLDYGRAVDIAAYRKQTLADGGTAGKGRKGKGGGNRGRLGAHANRPSGQNRRWYARTMYAGLNRLVARIMYGITDAEIARIKGIIASRRGTS